MIIKTSFRETVVQKNKNKTRFYSDCVEAAEAKLTIQLTKLEWLK